MQKYPESKNNIVLTEVNLKCILCIEVLFTALWCDIYLQTKHVYV